MVLILQIYIGAIENRVPPMIIQPGLNEHLQNTKSHQLAHCHGVLIEPDVPRHDK